MPTAASPAGVRQYFLQKAACGLRMPIGTDLVLHEHADEEVILHDGCRLGQVVEEAAGRYRTPFAIPLMDLRLEKADLLAAFGIGREAADQFHFAAPPEVRDWSEAPFPARNQAHFDSIRYIREGTQLMPMGMAIGPFSLMTKLMSDPIVPIAMAGRGMSGADDEGVLLAERCLALAETAVRRSLLAQVRAGAEAVIVCEPAANIVYLSPSQLAKGSDIFERFVMGPNLRLKALLEGAGVELFFHDCGELNGFMVQQFAERLHPVVLSLGSSRVLWEDAALVPGDVVLFGNLPTKNFYSDAVVPLERVAALTRELVGKMKAVGHPHIPGSECDVLYVPDAAATIRRKVEVMLTA